jgi:hypothetical protein
VPPIRFETPPLPCSFYNGGVDHRYLMKEIQPKEVLTSFSFSLFYFVCFFFLLSLFLLILSLSLSLSLSLVSSSLTGGWMVYYEGVIPMSLEL